MIPAVYQVWGNYFDGTIDEVRIYDSAATSAQVKELYKNGQYSIDTTTITSNDISASTMLPFWIASDEKGLVGELVYGENDYGDNLSDSNTDGYWNMDYPENVNTPEDSNVSGGEWDGIYWGVRDTNITLIMNQWNGGSNGGEIDITCPGGDSACYFIDGSGNTVATTSINYGVAVDDAASGTAYLMYSATAVRTRFTVHGSNSDNYVAVRYDGSNWEYNGNASTWTDFTPATGDTLVAELTLFTDSEIIISGYPDISTDSVVGNAYYFDGGTELLYDDASNYNSGDTAEDLNR